MSLLTEMYLLEKYGPLLDIDQCSAVIKLKPGTIRNRVSTKTLGIDVAKPGVEPLFPAASVAKYIDYLCQKAANEAKA